MDQKIIEFNKSVRTKKYPPFRSGDIVKIYRKIKEGDKERVQVFEGIIIAVKGGQSSSPKITVRKVTAGVGVELIVPVYSPDIEDIKLVKRARVKRSKLYYIRAKSTKQSRMKYKDISQYLVQEKEKTEEKVEQEADSKKEEQKEVENKEEKK